MGPGVAIFDFDNDGWMEIYFTNSGPADLFQPECPCATRFITTITTEHLPT